jgi:hypothetical protein
MLYLGQLHFLEDASGIEKGECDQEVGEDPANHLVPYQLLDHPYLYTVLLSKHFLCSNLLTKSLNTASNILQFFSVRLYYIEIILATAKILMKVRKDIFAKYCICQDFT